VWYFDLIKEDRFGNGKVVARTTKRGHYMVNLNVEQGEQLRVVSVAYDGSTKSSAVSITGNAPPVIEIGALSVPENSAKGTVVGTVQASDPEHDALDYYLSKTGNIKDAFAIDGATGEITVKNVEALDFEKNPVFNLVVNVSDQLSLTTKPIAVNVADVLNDPLNLALGQKARQSSTDDIFSSGVAGLAVDGNLGGSNQEVTHTADSERESKSWWEVDLGQISPSIKEIKIYNRTGRTAWRLRYYTVCVSDVPFIYSEDGTVNYPENTNVNCLYQRETAGRPTVIPVNRSGRYVVVFFRSKGRVLSLAEVEVIGITTGEVNTLSVRENNTETFYTAATFHGAAAGDKITFSLGTSGDESFFQLDENKISFKNAPDYENPQGSENEGRTYLLELKARDESGNSGERVLKITVTDDEAPMIVSDNRTEVPENTAEVLAVKADDVETNTTITYRISGGADRSKFSIDKKSGALTFNTPPDFEAKGSANNDNTYVVQVTANDGENDSPAQAITVTVTDVNEAPVFADGPFTFTIDEDANVRTNVGDPVTAADEDDGQHLTYDLTGVNSGDFTIDENGQITVAGNLDHETKGTYSLTATAADDDATNSLSATATVTITVTDVNEAPRFTDSSVTFSIAEDAAANADVGTPVTAADEDKPKQTLTYTLSGDNSSDFAIDGNGQLTVVGDLDHETKGTYSLTVTAADDDAVNSLSAMTTVTITVDDVNEAPVFADGTVAFTIDEDANVNANVGAVVAATDEDEGQHLTYDLTGVNSSDFAIDNEGQITVAGDLDHETTDEYTLTVTARDDHATNSLSAAVDITINVTDVNEAPTGLTLTHNRINEGVVIGVPVAHFTTTDPDTGGNFIYRLATGMGDTDNSAFTIVGDKLRINSSPDYETQSSYSIRVSTTDAGGSSYSESFTITVVDLNDNTPMITSDVVKSVAENTPLSTVLLTVSADDADANAKITYSISGGDDRDKFSIDKKSGALTFKAAPDSIMR
ncbi:MAG: cadherin domain-containing protein, partial [Ekhidna sp.]|nr:cadherin domain-containing protein [Ekhidna sp.]